MDIDSDSKEPTKLIFRGTFSIAIICLLTIFPYQSIYKPIVDLNKLNKSEPLRIVQKDSLLPRIPQPKNIKHEQIIIPWLFLRKEQWG